MEEKQYDQWGPELVVKVFHPRLGMSGVLVVDNTVLGPGKGGIRMTAGVNEEEVRRLARAMTWKNALAGIPFGGAKAGIVWPMGGSDDLKKQFVQEFAKGIASLTPEKYVGGPDVNTGEKEMQWFVEATGNWRSATGKPAALCMLVFGEGKSEEHCGIPHEFGSTGFGVAQSTNVAAEMIGLNLRGATVSIHGFGNVGTFAYKFLEEMGAKVIAIADAKGAVVVKDGFDKTELNRIIDNHLSIIEYQGGEKIAPEIFWEVSVDILIPASVTDVINDTNKAKIKTKLIVEGANIPMRENVERELWEKGIVIIPDFVANAGGVISSYAEYQGYNPEKMFTTVEEKIVQSTREVLKKSLEQKRFARDVAMELAMEKIKKAKGVA